MCGGGGCGGACVGGGVGVCVFCLFVCLFFPFGSANFFLRVIPFSREL